MSDLIIIGYDDEATAEQALGQVKQLQKDMIVDLIGVAVVTVDEKGKTHVDTPVKPVGAGAAFGALWGVLIGLLFVVPFFGLALGGAMGALMGVLSKSGIDDSFREQVKGLLEPGKAALVIMTNKLTEDKFNAAMQPYGGTVLKTSLSDEHEAELAAELQGTKQD